MDHDEVRVNVLYDTVEHTAGQLVRRHIEAGGTLPPGHAWCVQCPSATDWEIAAKEVETRGAVGTIPLARTIRREDPARFGMVRWGDTVEIWFALERPRHLAN